MSAAPVACCAIDGPSGVGKGTAAKWLSAQLGWHLLDSGAMYRVGGIAATDAGIALDDPEAVAERVRAMDVRFDGGLDDERILLDGREISQRVRSEDAGMAASRIAVHPAVREALLAAQRDFLKPPGLVADGRDMGSVVFPDAPLKVFLDASAAERARRRCKQLWEAGRQATMSDVLADIEARDARDRGRAVAPLAPASDAVVIDTTDLDVASVCQRILGLIRERGLV